MVKNFHNFYDLNPVIKIRYFKGTLLSNIRNYKFIRAILLTLLRLIPKFFNLLDPEIKISNYCIRNKFDLVFCRESLRAAYNNIVHNIPTIIDSHGSEIPDLHNILKLRNNKYFRSQRKET